MFGEFFWRNKRTAAGAWAGLLVIVGYAFFLATVKAQLNQFYADFYDLLQEGGTLAASGSGEVVSLEACRARVYAHLYEFGAIIAPLVYASPACRWIRSAWAFSWRAALMKAYLAEWDTLGEPIEGASQRLHEDTQRFSSALQGCLMSALDAVFTLFVFSPILVDLSRKVAPPIALGPLSAAWLWIGACVASIIGLLVACLLGRRLVGLEVANQRVEALLRKDLVLLETNPAVIVGGSSEETRDPTGRLPTAFQPLTYFQQTLQSLRENYFLLFKHFGLLNFWLSLFDQFMVIAPYVVAAPLIFAEDPATRITLGTLMKFTNSFAKVFSSLSVISENWGQINDFRSTYRRLSEFESQLYASNAVRGALLPEDAPPPSPRDAESELQDMRV